MIEEERAIVRDDDRPRERERDSDEAIERSQRRIADLIDGYDRDDLGESPDF